MGFDSCPKAPVAFVTFVFRPDRLAAKEFGTGVGLEAEGDGFGRPAFAEPAAPGGRDLMVANPDGRLRHESEVHDLFIPLSEVHFRSINEFPGIHAAPDLKPKVYWHVSYQTPPAGMVRYMEAQRESPSPPSLSLVVCPDQPAKYLRHPRPADAEMAGESRPAFEPAAVEQSLGIGERVSSRPAVPWGLAFAPVSTRKGIPGAKDDYG